jgi:TonB-dependent receptor
VSASTGYHPEVVGKTILQAPNAGREWLGLGAGARGLPEAARAMPGDARRGPQVNAVVNSFRNAWSVREGAGSLPISLAASLGGTGPLPLLDREVGYLFSATYSLSNEVALDQRRSKAGTGGTVYDAYQGESGTQSVLWGGIANLSTMVGNHTRISLDNTYNRSADNEARREVGTDENTRSRVMVDRLTYVERAVRSSQIKAEHQIGADHRLDWALSSSGVTRSEPDRSEFVTWLDPATPVWFNDFEGAVRSFGELDENSLEGSADYQRTFRLGGRSHLFRAGGRYRQTSRDASATGFRIQAYYWAEDDPRWQLPPEEFFDGRYATDNDANFLLSRELAGGSYDALDHLGAGYGMVDLGLTSWLRLVGGARVEYYTLTVNSENALGQLALSEREYTDVLPALALNVDLPRDNKLRLSVGRTLARPEYRELAPITYREVLGGEQVIGNDALERTLIDNFDLRWEWYMGLSEVLSVGLFAKRFQNPIEQRFLARSGTDTRTFENAESAENYGVELEVMKNLAFIASALEPLSLFSNLTLMESTVDTGNPLDVERRMVGQAPWVVNTGLTWASGSGRLSATAFYNVVGPRIVNARASGTMVDDVVESPRHLVDLSFRFPFRGGMAAKVDFRNLLDSPYEVLQGGVTRNYHRIGRSISMGVSRQF